ncbi:type II toxin-antitoxin system HipA family toxin [Desulfofustis glycolicus]|uniref:Serine/threonine-protein kinase HipA n=1 Tax=Desulfofustis glycolicus DSM 9705 TaxID=1121409 RepID=A0A1M5V527_9BACT|nr:type II toxin-antitoxin system HipA family toxin [Desulfofustis glycolicus]MCB2214997.1 type II toxin-antitoxin system HipA family toxin [Desulfobulbaceae bacterium]SHH70204.1 serine/threonine-protein kinase HipA [Desulfofustis glycolicus DSM 9705]
MIKLIVWLNLEIGRPVRAGELVVADPDPRGGLQGQFRYAESYLTSGTGFALDPIHLPLEADLLEVNRPQAGIHAVFEDSLPDDWGRQLLVRRHRLAGHARRPPQLLPLLAGDGMGALSYSSSDRVPSQQTPVGGRKLAELQRQAMLFESGIATPDEDLTLLFQAGSLPGGARPKALIQKNGTAWLAKFASSRDHFDVVALEAAAMQLARLSGIDTPQTKLTSCGEHKALLVERFDLDLQKQTRTHVISMKSLLGVEGFYYLGYQDMAAVIRKISSYPAEDLLKLFRQMVFNALIGNTDDHLKNFCFYCNGRSWRLSPAFDLVPDIGRNREHVLRIGSSTMPPDRRTLRQEAKHFGIKRQARADEVIDTVLSSADHLETVFTSCGVPEADHDHFSRDISRRLKRLHD